MDKKQIKKIRTEMKNNIYDQFQLNNQVFANNKNEIKITETEIKNLKTQRTIMHLANVGEKNG